MFLFLATMLSMFLYPHLFLMLPDKKGIQRHRENINSAYISVLSLAIVDKHSHFWISTPAQQLLACFDAQGPAPIMIISQTRTEEPATVHKPNRRMKTIRYTHHREKFTFRYRTCGDLTWLPSFRLVIVSNSASFGESLTKTMSK